MRLAIMTEPQQGLSYAEILAVAQATEAAGFSGFFRSDHYASFPGAAGLATTDCWATLAGLARETSAITLGALVSPITFRLPGPYLKMAMTVDEMSGGRVEVGIGAGWNELEHAQLGMPFPDVPERVDMLEEALNIFVGLWDGPDGWSFGGAYWKVSDGYLRPKSRPEWMRPDGRARPKLIVGGTGKPRSVRLGARFADEYNISSSSPEKCIEIRDRLRDECRKIGRDPDTIVISAMAGTLVGETESDFRSRLAEQLVAFGQADDDADEWVASRSDRWIIGTAERAREQLAAFEAVGLDRVMLQIFLPRDLEMVALLGRTFLS